MPSPRAPPTLGPEFAPGVGGGFPSHPRGRVPVKGARSATQPPLARTGFTRTRDRVAAADRAPATSFTSLLYLLLHLRHHRSGPHLDIPLCQPGAKDRPGRPHPRGRPTHPLGTVRGPAPPDRVRLRRSHRMPPARPPPPPLGAASWRAAREPPDGVSCSSAPAAAPPPTPRNTPFRHRFSRTV